MDVDPRTNVVVFQLNDGSEEVVVGRAPTLAEDGVRQAWEGVRHEHSSQSASVVALHSEWEPSPRDTAYIETTFPEAAVTFNFLRPTPDGWEEAFAAAKATMLEAAAVTDSHAQPTATNPQPADPTTDGPAGKGRDMSAGHGQDQSTSHEQDESTGHERAQATGHERNEPTGHERDQATGPERDKPTSHERNEATRHERDQATGPERGEPTSHERNEATSHGRDEATGHGKDQAASHGQDASTSHGELLPVLWSQSSPRVGMLEAVPHWPVASGRLHLALAVVAPTAHGTIGMYHVTHEQLGEHPFNELMAEACENLASGLRVNGHETNDGQLLSLSGPLVSAMVCLPDFYRRLSELANTERLIVGLPCPDEVYVAAADSPVAAVIHQAVHQSEYPTTELVPSVLSIVGDDIEVLSERD